MGYQNVGTPRFYISWGDWWATMGTGYVHPTNILEPYNTHNYNVGTLGGSFGGFTTDAPYKVAPKRINFFAVLNHNISNMEYQYRLLQKADPYEQQYQEDIPAFSSFTSSVNMTATGDGFTITYPSAQYSGFSIGTFNNHAFADDLGGTATKVVSGIQNYALNGWVSGTGGATIGCFVFGRFYDMPHSSELNLTMSREMDGVKKIRTKGGSDLVKHSYIKPPLWGSLAPWELSDGYDLDQTLSRVGRRNWSLSFNYLQDSDVFPDVSSLNNYEALGYSSSNTGTEFTNTLFDDDSFFGSVIHRTNGGQLPFIFQPDKNNGNDFAICKFDQSSFQFNQVANGVYNVKLKIREVW